MSESAPQDPSYVPTRAHILRREGIVIFKVLMPFFAIIAIGFVFHEFVVHAIEVNLAINGLIIGAATYGVVLIVIRLVSAQMDFYVIERFGREAMQGVYMPQLLEQPWLKRRYVRHYLGHIAHTGGTLASALQQNAIENELKALASEYEHKLEMPQFVVGFMVAMGLLGTFIGLLETLTGISSMLDGFGGSGANMEEQFMKLVGELKKPLAGMGIAFSASMFGLITSLMLAIMMIGLRRYIGRVVSCARNVMHDLTELGRAASGGAAGASVQMSAEQIAAMSVVRKPTVGSVTNEGDSPLEDLLYKAHDTSLMIANRIDGLARKIETVLQAFDSSIKSTQKMTDLLGFGPRMKETSENMLSELKGMAIGQIEQQKLSQQLIDANVNMVRLIGGVIEAQRDTQAGLTASIKDLGDRLVKIEESSNNLGRHLWDIKENFTKVGAYSEVADAISTGVGHQTLLLETLVKEDRNLQKRLISIQQDIRERTVQSSTATAASGEASAEGGPVDFPVPL